MGGVSIWHWIVVLLVVALPLAFLLRKAPPGPNRFGAAPGRPQDFPAAIASFFRNYATFSGRASRSEFWWPVLMLVGVSVILGVIDRSGVLEMLWSLAVLLPGLALSARRLHDLNRSGWLQLLSLFAPVGVIGLIVWYATPPRDTSVASDVEAVFR
ncbi:hypothetical protein GCM10019059_23730 [Camelimonas fluminis]|uniref:DUF805 domain-containing protein n=1 Tax=Camelimonas fluminis TaxID=1576911 RepID=A0ABV7UH71_9HYPH|nr:DUF805 domain-containing protein [Camelimonas fluminis]GHE63362.1 hypothetical protein GCM10019059_23730 [Camelimonas fluminis]